MNGNGTNGSWRNWILGIVAGLILLGVGGNIVVNIDAARQLGSQAADIRNLQVSLTEKTLSRFSKEDADRLEARLNRRIDALEARIK